MKSLRNFVLPSFQALIHDVQVSWLRRRGPEMSLLTTNQLVFSVDTRLGVSRWGTRRIIYDDDGDDDDDDDDDVTGRGTTGVW